MESRELLVICNRQAAELTMPMLEDLRTAPLVPATPGGNHAHWVVGHLLFSEGRFLSIMQGTENPFEIMKHQFGGQSIPDAAGTGYRQYSDLLNQLQMQQQSMMSFLEALTEAELDQPCDDCPRGLEGYFGTWRNVLLMRPMHWMMHRGQLADCRRAAGRTPLFA